MSTSNTSPLRDESQLTQAQIDASYERHCVPTNPYAPSRKYWGRAMQSGFDLALASPPSQPIASDVVAAPEEAQTNDILKLVDEYAKNKVGAAMRAGDLARDRRNAAADCRARIETAPDVLSRQSPVEADKVQRVYFHRIGSTHQEDHIDIPLGDDPKRHVADALIHRVHIINRPVAASPSDTSQGVSEEICQSCHGSGEGKCMTWGHGPDDYEVDCPCKDCDGTGIKRDPNSWRQALEFAASTMSSNWPERCQEIVRRARAALRSEPTGEQS